MVQGRTRWVRAVLAALLAGLLAGIVPASAACEQGIAFCDLEVTTGELAHLRQIAAVLPLRVDNEGRSTQTYRQLVPTEFDIPVQPLVGVAVREVAFPHGPLAGASGRRLEAALALLVVAEGETGWWPLRVATDSAERRDWGRGVGWPTVDAAGAVVDEGDGRAGRAEVAGEPVLALGWVPQTVGISQPTLDWTLGNHPFHSFAPASPDRYRVKVTAKPPAPVFDPVGGAPLQDLAVPGATGLSPVQRGPVTVRLAADLGDWDAGTETPPPPAGGLDAVADLVELEQTVSGLFWETDVLLLTEARNTGDDRSGPVPLPPVVGIVIAGPNNQGLPFLTPVVVVTRGSTVTFANLDAAGPNHDVTSDARGPDYRPLFRSAFVGPGQTAEVEGVPGLPVGEYPFHCSIHPSMTGLLVVR
jgi:plastocyanin